MNQGWMMKDWRRTITSALAAGLAAITISNTHASAQARVSVKVQHKDEAGVGSKPEVVRQLESEIGTALSDYWQERLNAYRVRVDATLSESDLAALNKLRVRFAVLVSELLREARADEHATAIRKDDDRDREVTAIFNETREIAGRNRAGLLPIGELVRTDLAGCVRSIHGNVDNFAVGHRAELEAAGMTTHLREGSAKLDSLETWIGSTQGRMMYGLAYEYVVGPLVMLFDGGSLKTLLDHFQQMTRHGGVDASGLAKMNPLPGVALPEVSVLKQSVPNPATSTLSIPYTLPTASSGAVLRIFNSRGALVAGFNRGAEAAGDHTIDVDVSKYPAGTYYYRLSVDEGGTQRVYSRTLQVVR